MSYFRMSVASTLAVVMVGFVVFLGALAAPDLAAWVYGEPPVALFELSESQTAKALEPPKPLPPRMLGIQEVLSTQASTTQMYAQLARDIDSGRRAATKSGLVEREPVEGVDWWVLPGRDPFTLAAPEMAGLGSLEAPEPALFVEEGLTRGSLEGFRPYLGRSPGFCCCCEESYVTPPRSVEVPEPSTWALMLTGAVIILAARLYRRRKQ